jgi:hypothetical protein
VYESRLHGAGVPCPLENEAWRWATVALVSQVVSSDQAATHGCDATRLR